MGIASMAGGNLEKFLQELDLRQTQFNSIADLYDYLLKNASEQGYSIEDVDNLMARFLSQKDLNLFYEELQDHSSDSLAKTLKNLDLSANGIYHPKHCLIICTTMHLQAIITLKSFVKHCIALPHLTGIQLELIKLLESYATGELAAMLGKMKQDWKAYPDTRSVADYIMKGCGE